MARLLLPPSLLLVMSGWRGARSKGMCTQRFLDTDSLPESTANSAQINSYIPPSLTKMQIPPVSIDKVYFSPTRFSKPPSGKQSGRVQFLCTHPSALFR